MFTQRCIIYDVYIDKRIIRERGKHLLAHPDTNYHPYLLLLAGSGDVNIKPNLHPFGASRAMLTVAPFSFTAPNRLWGAKVAEGYTRFVDSL